MGRARLDSEQTSTNAERCKRYRKKKGDKYKSDDSLRKWSKLEMIRKNPLKNEQRLKDQAEKKKLYRQRKKYEANMNMNNEQTTSTPAEAPKVAFTHSSTKARSIKKVESALPRSPRKREEVVKALASNFLRVQFKSTSKRGRPSDLLNDEQEEWLVNFLDRDDISRQTPGRKDTVYIGKVNGEKRYLQKRYLLWKIRDLLDIANGSEDLFISDTYGMEFGSNLKFWQLYKFLKKHKEYKWNRDICHESCVCEVCENSRLFLKAVNKKLKKDAPKFPTTAREIAEDYSCNRDNLDCMMGNCMNCPKLEVPLEFFQKNRVTNDESEEVSTDNEEDEVPDITYYQWMNVSEKVQKVALKIKANEIEGELKKSIALIKEHIYIKNQQQKKYHELKDNLNPGEFLVHVDYAESYKNAQQDEIQTAYFGHQAFSMFTACCYTRDSEGELKKHCFVIISDSSDHSRIAAHTCISRVVRELKRIYGYVDHVHLWSDGCASQFRSRFVFQLTNHFPYEITRYYNERHHGKGPMDGIGGSVKNFVFRAVLSNKVVINTPEEFAIYADSNIKGISCIFLSEEEMILEPREIGETPYVPAMKALQVHMVKRKKTKDGTYLEFYKTAYESPFYTHLYH